MFPIPYVRNKGEEPHIDAERLSAAVGKLLWGRRLAIIVFGLGLLAGIIHVIYVLR